MLRLPGAWVTDLSFTGEGVIVAVRLRRRRRICSGCGQLGGQIHGRRVKRWRHLDLGCTRCFIECELRRLWCRDCGARFEAVPWARARSRYTRDFEDTVAWLAQQMAKTPLAGMLRIAWDSVGRIVERVVADHLDERRLSGLVAIGVDEIAYRRGARYLTSVVDHRSGAIVWCAPGRNYETLQGFFALLGERKRSIRAVSIDMSGGYEKAIRESLPDAEIAIDPFHVVRLAQRAVDQVRRDEWNAHERSHTKAGKWIKGTRWSLDRPHLPLLQRHRHRSSPMTFTTQSLGAPVSCGRSRSSLLSPFVRFGVPWEPADRLLLRARLQEPGTKRPSLLSWTMSGRQPHRRSCFRKRLRERVRAPAASAGSSSRSKALAAITVGGYVGRYHSDCRGAL